MADWKTIAPGLAQMGLPILGAAIGGPAGAAVGKLLAGAIGLATDAKPEDVAAAMGNLSGDQVVALKNLETQITLAQINQVTTLAQGQLNVNVEEAKSVNWFIAGGRPAVIWIGAIALAYSSIVEPVARFVATVLYHYNGAFPEINTTITMQLLFGVLGLGAYRTWEKQNKVENRH